MTIDYIKESAKYRPKRIKTLLVGEAPPPDGKSYFYVPKERLREDSLPATIFNHYFDEIPKTKERYKHLLEKLRDEIGIFLIDIYEKPIRIREGNWNINHENLKKVKDALPGLRNRMKERGINVKVEDIIFLMPSKNRWKKAEIKPYFKESKIEIGWAKFRGTIKD
jgi:hypothetical protein